MHFGFQQSPNELNVTGRSLLVNSIAYIARFTDDRPILRTPSYFVSHVYYYARHKIDRFLIIRSDAGPEKTARVFFSKEVLGDNSEEGDLRAWYVKNREFLQPGPRGRLEIDQVARRFGVGPARFDFIDQALDALEGGGERGELAELLLEKYVPTGAGRLAPIEEWRDWHDENKPFLFFSDLGGYRWYVDPLRKTRNERLRRLFGESRATLPPFEFTE